MMTMNRVRFQPGLSLPAFLERYATEVPCARALEPARGPDGSVCPRCAGTAHRRFQRSSGAIYRQCTACHRPASLRSRTIMDNRKLPLRTWLLAMYLPGQSKTNLSALEWMQHLGVSYPAAWRIKHKRMQAMVEREADHKLGGIVQLDDASPGGERNGGKAGRGSEHKRPFVIAGETTEDGHPRRAAIDPAGFTKAALSDWSARRLHPGADVYSDRLGAFRAREADHAHTVIEDHGHSRCEAENARWVHVVLSHLKHSLDGAYHACKFAKYAQRQLAQTRWRFNRRFDLTPRVPSLLSAASRSKPWPERALRDVPVFAVERSC